MTETRARGDGEPGSLPILRLLDELGMGAGPPNPDHEPAGAGRRSSGTTYPVFPSRNGAAWALPPVSPPVLLPAMPALAVNEAATTNPDTTNTDTTNTDTRIRQAQSDTGR